MTLSFAVFRSTLLVAVAVCLSTVSGQGQALAVSNVRPIDSLANTPLRRDTPASYQDGLATMRDGPNPRTISNLVVAQQDGVEIVNDRSLSNMVWAFGQMIDHDLDLTSTSFGFGDASFDIPVVLSDVFSQAGCVAMTVARSHHIGGDASAGPRQPVNEITPFIDASFVYGSDGHRAELLRALVDGKLKTSENGRMLPFNDAGLDNAGGTSSSFFVAGDIRANEQAVLTR